MYTHGTLDEPCYGIFGDLSLKPELLIPLDNYQHKELANRIYDSISMVKNHSQSDILDQRAEGSSQTLSIENEQEKQTAIEYLVSQGLVESQNGENIDEYLMKVQTEQQQHQHAIKQSSTHINQNESNDFVVQNLLIDSSIDESNQSSIEILQATIHSEHIQWDGDLLGHTRLSIDIDVDVIQEKDCLVEHIHVHENADIKDPLSVSQLSTVIRSIDKNELS